MVDPGIIEDCKHLIDSSQTLILATGNQADSHASYAPFVCLGKKFYILVSGLAEHTNNLINTKAKIGCMLIEDEIKSQQIFARKRLMFKAIPRQIESESNDWSQIMDKFSDRFGEIINLLNSLPDFVIFELKPANVVLVKGFGDAHQLNDVFGFD